MTSKRIKQHSIPSQENQSQSSSETPAPSPQTLKPLLLLQQLLSKSTVQQLHLLPKINTSLQIPIPLSRSIRTSQTSLQLNLLLSMRETLKLQTELSNKGNVHQTQSVQLISQVERIIQTIINFELKASDQIKATHSLNTDLLNNFIDNYTNEILLTCKPSIDKWNHLVMKNTSQKFGTLQKSPIDLINEISSASNKIIQLYNPQEIPQLEKRSELQIANKFLYEDSKMIHEILKNLMSFNKNFQAELKEGIVFKNTEQFLKDRLTRKTTKKDKVEHDEKKDRKIKFEIHEKLVDFIPICPNKSIIENREDVLANLFGKLWKKIDDKHKKTNDVEFFEDIVLV